MEEKGKGVVKKEVERAGWEEGEEMEEGSYLETGVQAKCP